VKRKRLYKFPKLFTKGRQLASVRTHHPMMRRERVKLLRLWNSRFGSVSCVADRVELVAMYRQHWRIVDNAAHECDCRPCSEKLKINQPKRHWWQSRDVVFRTTAGWRISMAKSSTRNLQLCCSRYQPYLERLTLNVQFQCVACLHSFVADVGLPIWRFNR